MRHLHSRWQRVVSIARSEQGQALIEYSLVLALVAVVSIAVLAALGTTVRGTYDHLNDSLEKVLGLHGHCGHKDCKP